MAAREASVIAVVDDDDAVRDSLAFLLTVSGHRVVAYASAADFLAQCNLCNVAGLILDHHMPKQTGLELLARLREDGRTAAGLAGHRLAVAGDRGTGRRAGRRSGAGEAGVRRGPDGIRRARGGVSK